MSDARIKQLISLEGPTMDWALREDNTLDEREELATAVRLALGTDRISDVNEILPDLDSTDRRGWWGDMDAEAIWDGWPIGCKNWLLTRAKILQSPSSEGSTVQRAKQYTVQALQPLIDKKIATRIDVTAERTDIDRIEVNVTIYRGPKVEIDLRYQLLWEEEGVIEEFRETIINTKIRVPYANILLSSTAILDAGFSNGLLTDRRFYFPAQANLELSSSALSIGRTSPHGDIALSLTAPIIRQNSNRSTLQANLALSPTAPSIARTILFVGNMGSNGQDFPASNTITLTSGSSWTVPSDCVLIDSVECEGAGAPGGAGGGGGPTDGGNGGSGGGGGAYARKNSVATTPGASIPYSIGLNSASTTFNTNVCVAAGASGSSAGNAASCIGDVKTSGTNGSGGSAFFFGQGGSGGAGGAGAAPFGGAGGGGGGGGLSFDAPGNPGGGGNLYGGGGGAGGGGAAPTGGNPNTPGGAGGQPGQGKIVINYTSKLFMTTTSTAPAGSTIIVGVGLNTNNGITATAVSDGTNTYTKIDEVAFSASDVSLWYTNNIAAQLSAGTKITVTTSGATGGGGCLIDAAYATGLAATPLDKNAHISATSGTSVSVATGTLSQATELVFGFGADISGIGTTVYNGASGFNNLNKAGSTGQGVSALDWQITHATTTVTFTPSWGSAVRMGAIVASFKG